MNIQVRSKHIEVDQMVRDHIERRLQFELGRFSTRVLRVTIRFADLNGPRGGVDKDCRMKILLLPTGNIFVKDTGTGLRAAFDRAANRAGRTMARTVKRSQI